MEDSSATRCESTRSDPAPDDARRRVYRLALRGGAVKIAGLGGRFVVTFATQVALARLLVPDDFGRYALCVLGAELLIAISNLQLGSYYIQLRSSRPEASLLPAVLMQVALSLIVLGGAQLAAAPALAALGGSDLLGPFRLMLLGLVPVPVSIVLRASFERDQRYGRSTWPGIVALPVQALVAIPLALQGAGVTALVAGYLAKETTECCILAALAFRAMRAKRPRFAPGEALRFCGPLVLTGVLAFVYWHADDGLVAAFLGETSLGEYHVAFRFPHFLFALNTPLVVVALSVFSRLRDSDRDLREAYEAITTVSAYAFMAVASVGVAVTVPFIRHVLGDKWLPAAAPMQIFFALVALRCPLGYWTALYESRGVTRRHVAPTAWICALVLLGGVFVTPVAGTAGMASVVLGALAFSLVVLVPAYVRKLLPGCSPLRLLVGPLLVAVGNVALFQVIRRVVPQTSVLALVVAVALLILFDVALIACVERRRLARARRWLLA